jgi:hypothetical protein
MPDPLPPQPGPQPPWTGLIKTRNDRVVNEKVPFVAGLTLLKDFKFTKKDNATSDAERRKFKSSICGNWLKGLAGSAEKVAHLKAAGLTDADIKRMAEGLRPIGYEVHHKLALDDGGTNDPSNFVIIKNDPYHIAITALHNSKCRDIPEGTTVTVDWPVPDGIVYPPPPPAPPA